MWAYSFQSASSFALRKSRKSNHSIENLLKFARYFYWMYTLGFASVLLKTLISAPYWCCGLMFEERFVQQYTVKVTETIVHRNHIIVKYLKCVDFQWAGTLQLGPEVWKLHSIYTCMFFLLNRNAWSLQGKVTQTCRFVHFCCIICHFNRSC